jgi:hypothetical protein
MGRRERLEARAARRREWSGKAEARSAQAFGAAARIADGIPFGQPILIGHHSEKRARKDAARIRSGMDRGCAESKLASHHESKAHGLEMQLERSIYSDDADAIEALEAKAKACDEGAALCNAINRAWRKGGRQAIAAGWGEAVAKRAEADCAQFSWLARKGPMSATSDRAEARRCRERIREIRARRAQAEKADAAGGVVVVRHPPSSEGAEAWATVTFAEKPDREVLIALRAAGYHWGGGRWQGYADKLPECVTELVERAEELRKADAGECLCSDVDAYTCVPCEQAQASEGESEAAQ